jgi:hypothetical protein
MSILFTELFCVHVLVYFPVASTEVILCATISLGSYLTAVPSFQLTIVSLWVEARF